LIAPTYLPITGDQADSTSSFVAVVNVASGRYSLVPIHLSNIENTGSVGIELRWIDNDTIGLILSGEERLFSRSGNHWEPVFGTTHVGIRPSGVSVEIDEDLDTPPRLFGIDQRSEKRELLFDPNPRLGKQLRLGAVETTVWEDRSGNRWPGHLYYPLNYDPHRRYPLVIQLPGARPLGGFSLYGNFVLPTLGPSGPGSAAQALASRGIMVLQIGTPEFFFSRVGTPAETALIVSAIESAVDHLASEGLVNPDRIGLSGWSREGFYVDYFLTHSPYRIAAALTADNYDGSYFTQTMYPLNHSPYGAEPFGDGLKIWIREAPGFNWGKGNVTPLRIELDTGGLSHVATVWEPFSRLRSSHRPVELYVIPDIDHGTHVLQNPRQLLASLGGLVDWFDFWLNGHEDPDPGKRQQYSRWEKLCDLQRTEIAGHPTFCIPSPRHQPSAASTKTTQVSNFGFVSL